MYTYNTIEKSWTYCNKTAHLINARKHVKVLQFLRRLDKFKAYIKTYTHFCINLQRYVPSNYGS